MRKKVLGHEVGDVVRQGYLVVVYDKIEMQESCLRPEEATLIRLPGSTIDYPILAEIDFTKTVPVGLNQHTLNLLRALDLAGAEGIQDILIQVFAAGVQYATEDYDNYQ